MRHINGFLKNNVKLVKGITLNSNLYTRMVTEDTSKSVDEIESEEQSSNVQSSESTTSRPARYTG